VRRGREKTNNISTSAEGGGESKVLLLIRQDKKEGWTLFTIGKRKGLFDQEGKEYRKKIPPRKGS